MINKRKELLPDHREYELEPGFKVGAHKRSCLFCRHCSDVWWDHMNGPYMFLCEFDDIPCGKEHDPERSFVGECPAFEEEDGDDGEDISICP